MLRGVFITLLFFSLQGYSQQMLRISWKGVLAHKTREIFTGENLEYKLRGERHFRRNKICGMRDSLIVLDNEAVIKLREIKSIRYHKHLRIQETLGKFLIDLGILFIVLDTANNILTNQDEAMNVKAVYAAAGLCAAGALLRFSQVKTLRTGKGKVLQIIDISYQDLNHK